MGGMHHALRTIRLAAFLCTSIWGVHAQQVYRCDIGGKVSYAHEPCLGAQAIDTTPTEGLNQSTGRVQRHPDVQRQVFQRELHEAMRPISVLSPETLQRLSQRYKLSRSAQLECAVWDQRLPGFEQAAAKANAAQKASAELELFQARQHFRDLRC
jgi:hypothetical protein